MSWDDREPHAFYTPGPQTCPHCSQSFPQATVQSHVDSCASNPTNQNDE